MAQNPAYRRRDLNVVPVMLEESTVLRSLRCTFRGVYFGGRDLDVPVIIEPDGSSSMADPLDPKTFKQAMNNYASATQASPNQTQDMYVIIYEGSPMDILTAKGLKRG